MRKPAPNMLLEPCILWRIVEYNAFFFLGSHATGRCSSFLWAKVRVQQQTPNEEDAGPGWALCKVLLVATPIFSPWWTEVNTKSVRKFRNLSQHSDITVIAENAQPFKTVCARGPR